MKRVLSVIVVLGLCIFSLGCPSGEEVVTESEGIETPVVTEGGKTPVTPAGKFKEGIESGRAADGSDEDK